MTESFQTFTALHVPGNPLILFNVWDAGSAIAAERAGAKAIATGSASVAAAQGMKDGEILSINEALANAQRIAGAVHLPVTVDFEGDRKGVVEGKSVAVRLELGGRGVIKKKKK